MDHSLTASLQYSPASLTGKSEAGERRRFSMNEDRVPAPASSNGCQRAYFSEYPTF
ncbi:hypothetical protein ABE504_12950 [Paenibacillus oryzisoli]|uniref:hypothetical protein n=1 Tax=Paenibacillus oryzisoli TaxID=1850517 RepID=UPI003D29E488